MIIIYKNKETTESPDIPLLNNARNAIAINLSKMNKNKHNTNQALKPFKRKSKCYKEKLQNKTAF